MQRESIKQMIAKSRSQVQQFRDHKMEQARQEGREKVSHEKQLIYKFEREAQ